jgi:uncharacterized protein YukE
MSRPDDSGENPYHASTDFEGFTHAQLLDMIENADPAKITDLARRLNSISTQTEKIGTDLQTHMSKVQWDGKSGDAFRDWGSRVSSATLTLSDYSSTAGIFMQNAGEILGDVKRDMPKVPTLAYHTVVSYRTSKNIQGPYADTVGVTQDHLDGVQGPYSTTPTDAQYKSAVTQLDNARSSAADQMNKLGQAYNMATDVISKAPEPTFPPPPATIMPPRPLDRGGSEYVPGGTGTTGSTGSTNSTTKVPLNQHFSVPSNQDLGHTTIPNTPPPIVPPESIQPVDLPPDSDLNLDSWNPTPTPTPTTPLPTVPTLPVPTQPGPVGMPTPVPMPPSFGPVPSLGPSGYGPGGLKVPVEELPPLGPKGLAGGRLPLEQESQGLTQNSSGYGRSPLTGRMPVPGIGGTPAPGTSGLPVPGGGGSFSERPTTRSTITGGRQRVGGVEGEEGAVPRGTVIGGGGVGGGQGRGGLRPTSFGAVGERSKEEGKSRRRAGDEEPESVIGGTPTRDDRRARRNVRNFTSGGAGLAREEDEATATDGESPETPQEEE